MFSLQQLFGKADRFQKLLEEAAVEAQESVRIVNQFIASHPTQEGMANLGELRRKEKRIAAQISEQLVGTFVTGLDREDIEALARALHRIPKSAEKIAERMVMAGPHLNGVDLTAQAAMMLKATEVVVALVRQLRQLSHLEKVRDLNDRLQQVEGEADELMLELLKELYSGKYGALQAMVLRDIYELMEKVIDRCRDAGNVVSHIMLKHS